jgi:site-specific DNA-methyltransferase (adenine-specific)
VEIPVRAISNSSETGDIVLDFFGGSGSTLIAAANLGRKAYGLEISKRFYVDARDAMQNYIQPDMFAMQESRYYQRKMAQEQTLALDI